ncbi:lysozyme inhibitor LprI family protein [Tateyamaria sp. SN3-11]|uniref:lysozyme inhibitor LprI family protein n=1 Tax=Tateyamaria sp. SN3-11 TaxID=3092147 RepID=UPI0039EB46AA
MPVLAVVCAVAVLWPLSAQAQTLDCTNPTTQVEMTGCAARAFEAADGDLNLAYGIAMDQARRLDSYNAQEPSNEALMRDAQRKWIPFRDAACSAESTLARGGSMQSQLFLICMERLTRARTEDLRLYGEVN